MQELNVDLTIKIPEDYVLIKKVELDKLKNKELEGVYWGMKELEERVGKKQNWIKSNILYLPRFKQLLDVDSGGFVFYPKSQGQTWAFQANKMVAFLDNHFIDIFSNSPKEP
jgi:phage pi2 protein 07